MVLEGAKILAFTCNDQDNQLFGFEACGDGYRIHAKHTLMCVDVVGSSASDGALLQQAQCADRASQRFKIVTLPPPSPPPPPPCEYAACQGCQGAPESPSSGESKAVAPT